VARFEDDELGEEDVEAGDGTADDTATVTCPYCGEKVEIALDAGGDESQEYVEDCEVCCRPWTVKVHFGPAGVAEVQLERLE